MLVAYLFLFLSNASATTHISTLSLHDALPICGRVPAHQVGLEEAELDPLRQSARHLPPRERVELELEALGDRKSTRLNSSHTVISYAVFCLKKKNNT